VAVASVGPYASPHLDPDRHIYNTHNVIMKTGIMHKNQLAETDLLRAVPLQFAKELHINFILHV